MAADGVVRINTKLNTAGFNTGMKEMLAGLKSIAGAVGIAFGVASLVKFGKECINLSSDLAEVDNVVSKSFGNLRGQMDALANESIKTLGMSRLTAYQTGSTFMAMGKSMLDSEEAAAEMAITLTKLTGNMASFYNKEQDVVSVGLKSIYTGETETLKQYGIVMTEVNLEQFRLEQGITKTYKSMSQAEKVQLRYQYVLAQTSFVGQDFLDTQDSWANQTRILSEQWKEFMTVIGNGLVTVLTPVIKVLNNIVAALITFANAVGAVMSKLFGIKGQTFGVAASAESAAGGYEDMAESADAAGKSASKAGKAAKGALAGFDDLNVLQQKSGSGSGSGGAGGGSSEITAEDIPAEAIAEMNPMLDALKNRLLEIKDIIAEGFWAGLGDVNLDSLKESIRSIHDSLIAIVTDPEVLGAMNNCIDSWAYALGQFAGAIAAIAITIATNLVGGIAKYLERNTERIKDYLINMIDISSKMAEIQGNMSQAFANIFSVFGGETAQQITADLIGIFADGFMGITQLCAEFALDILDIITRPFIDNQEGIKTALEGILEIVQTITGAIKETVDTWVDSALAVYDEHLHPLFDSIAQGLSELLGEFLEFWKSNMQPMLSEVGNKLGTLFTAHIAPLLVKVNEFVGAVADAVKMLWEGVLKPLISWVIQNVLPVLVPILKTILDVVIDVFGAIFDYIGGLIEALTGIINFIVGIFTGNWEQAWNGIQQLFEGSWNAMRAVVEAIMSVIYAVIQTVLNAIKAIFTTILNAIKSFVTTTFNAIKTVITTIINGIKAGIQNALNTIKTVWTNIFNAIKNTTTNIFNGIWNTIKGVINSILGGIEKMANGVIDGINTVIDALNGLSFTIPDWVPGFGGSSWSMSISKLSGVSIPRLANGGITAGRTLAEIGEAGREAILPLENNTEWMGDLADRIVEAIGGIGNGRATLVVDGNELGQIVFPLINNESARIGTSLALN